MFSINKEKFFNILSSLNKTCVQRQIKDKAFVEVPKFNNLLDFINLNEYDLDYNQNRLIAIKNKRTPIEFIKNIIICPFDSSKELVKEECENITYTFPVEKKKTYLTSGNEESINETYCIKGFMNPGILNSIMVYMLNTKLIPLDTLVIFSLKANDSKFDNDDIIEYIQKSMNYCMISFKNVINLNFTSLNKGYPNRDYTHKVIINSTDNRFFHKTCNIERIDYRLKKNFDVELRLNDNFNSYKKLLTYFKIPNYAESRLFVFSEKPIINKFHALVNNEFLVEWNSVEKFINQLFIMIEPEI